MNMPLLTIDVKDRNILKELNTNARQSYNSIAKKTRLSKNQVVYRTNRLIEIGLIKKFCSVINYPRLGYHYYRYFYTLEFVDDNIIKKIIESVRTMRNIYWAASCEGKYHLIVESIHKRVVHAIDQYLLIASTFSAHIK